MDKNTHADEVGVEDLVPIRSRVSWGAIFAGAVMALAVYLVLTLLGGAIGLSISNAADPSAQAFSTGAGIWAVLTTIIALFVGGWVTSQCTVGENKKEAVVHAIIMWGIVLFMTMWLLTAGMSAGFSAMWGLANFTSETAAAADPNWQAMARQAGISQEQINQWQQEAAQTTQEATDPQSREAAMDYATAATWYTLLGTLLSMGAAIGGALLGAGPSFRLLGTSVLTRRTTAVHS